MDDPRKSMNTLFMWVRYHAKIWFQTIWYYVKCKHYFNYKLFCHVTSFHWDDNTFIRSVLDFRYFPECCWTGWLGKITKKTITILSENKSHGIDIDTNAVLVPQSIMDKLKEGLTLFWCSLLSKFALTLLPEVSSLFYVSQIVSVVVLTPLNHQQFHITVDIFSIWYWSIS